MALDVSRTAADQYFREGAHLRWKDWSAAGTKDREAALSQATRELELSVGRTMTEAASGWASGPRDDYAVFEQALYLIEELPRMRGQGVSEVVDLGKRGDTKERNVRDIGIAPMAQRWLGGNRLRAVRG